MRESTPADHNPTQTYRGILLAGPPASGKRTVTFALTSLRRSYAPFPALTVGSDTRVAAERTTQRHLDELKAWAQVFHEFTSDGARYVYDRERLNRIREQGRIPVACVDDIDVLRAFEREADDWLQVLLWCPREEAERRLAATGVAPDRAAVRRWDRSEKGLLGDVRRFTVSIRTDRLNAVQVAQLVHHAAQSAVAAPAPAGSPVE
ncbi:hypothetical protein [Pseudonocardia sp. TRM90224]|uniref:hypothetical protein n=1 Tax=Pseudonocardia sp. TRM90224 TaxID=2812678 RepID=UPI001E46367F|nr:hypothetical protein [Pseudonocardia sp. TRM90224]